VRETRIGYERFLSLCVWVCSVLAPLVVVILVFACGVEPPTWSAYVTVAAAFVWIITAPWGLIRGVIAYQEERDALGLFLSGASAAVLVLILVLLAVDSFA